MGNVIDYKSPWSIFVRPPRSSNSMSFRSHATRKPVDWRQHTPSKTKCPSQDSSSSSSIIPPAVCNRHDNIYQACKLRGPWRQKKCNVKLIPAFFLDEVIRHPELQGVHTKGRCNHCDQQLQVRAGSKPVAIRATQAICNMLLPCGSFLMNCPFELDDLSAGSLICNQNAAPKQFRLAQAMENGPLPYMPP